MNKATYFLTNGDCVIGTVYHSKDYGRTLVVYEKIDYNHPVCLYDIKTGKKENSTDFIEFLQSMIPE